MATLQGKIALVTGGSRGMGAAIAIEFARRGAQGVAITYASSKDKADEVVKHIKSHGAQAVAIKADLRDPAFGENVVKGTLDGLEVKGIDILVNNAAHVDYIPFENIDDENFAKMFEINIREPIKTVQAILRVIKSGGRIINISSRGARVALPGMFTLYAASKAALECITRGLATEYAAAKKITVNNVMPGPVSTDALSSVPQQMLDHLASLAMAEKRLGQLDDIAQICSFLAEEGSRWINGDTISATGGMDML
ncbi:hypothetical protein F5884DRAFT_849475 [Xylogone sp. PMI_703]|nr:hypothetical protein F5884DRAFT_849475 [Xylogone sp. PMI_703]